MKMVCSFIEPLSNLDVHCVASYFRKKLCKEQKRLAKSKVAAIRQTGENIHCTNVTI